MYPENPYSHYPAMAIVMKPYYYYVVSYLLLSFFLLYKRRIRDSLPSCIKLTSSYCMYVAIHIGSTYSIREYSYFIAYIPLYINTSVITSQCSMCN